MVYNIEDQPEACSDLVEITRIRFPGRGWRCYLVWSKGW